MRRSVAVSLRLLALLVLASTSVLAQVQTPTYEQLVGPNSVQGTEFWIAIPPNEVPGYTVNALEVYVTSAFDTEVTVYEAETQKTYKRTIKPGQIRSLSDSRGETNWSWEIRNGETVENHGIRLTAPKPISVYVLNSKYFTSDGYLAIPTALWGTDYIAVSYYDFQEIRSWGGGFLVVASEDGTEVNIDLKGVGADNAKTLGGRRINTGQPISIVLDKGQTYMVQGDGLTRGIFDMTGSRITSTKPVGVIGFHQRTTMPNLLLNGNGRNHLVEMLPPVSAWGKNYTTVEYSREHQGTGRGDMFRVIGAEPSTTITYKYYNKTTKAKLGEGTLVLQNAGDFADVQQSSAPIALPEGTSIWTSDKPFFVMQYSCSASWDNDINLDPFMINITPVEQFSKLTIFQQPTLAAFSKHRVNLIVQTDTSSADLIENLKSLTIDGKPVWSDANAITPKLLSNQIPGTDLYWTTLDFGTDATAHTVASNGNLTFGGYVYGYGQTDAYGWPAAAIIDDLRDTTVDSIPPKIMASGTPESSVITVSETRMAADPNAPVPFVVDPSASGIARIDFVAFQPSKISKNYVLTLLSDSTLPRYKAHRAVTFKLSVIDRTKDAVAYYYVMDWAGNVTYDSLRYIHVPMPVDTMRPLFASKKGSPKQLTIVASEMRNIPNPPRAEPLDGDQVETGLAELGLVRGDVAKTTANYSLLYVTDTTLNVNPAYKLFTFMLVVQDTTLPAKAYYYARDRANNITIDSAWYKPESTTDVAVATDATPFRLTAFPQPATSTCHVQWTHAAESSGTLKLVDLQGRHVWQGSIASGQTEASIDVSDLSRGSYFLVVTFGGETATLPVQIK